MKSGPNGVLAAAAVRGIARGGLVLRVRLGTAVNADHDSTKPSAVQGLGSWQLCRYSLKSVCSLHGSSTSDAVNKMEVINSGNSLAFCRSLKSRGWDESISFPANHKPDLPTSIPSSKGVGPRGRHLINKGHGLISSHLFLHKR